MYKYKFYLYFSPRGGGLSTEERLIFRCGRRCFSAVWAVSFCIPHFCFQPNRQTKKGLSEQSNSPFSTYCLLHKSILKSSSRNPSNHFSIGTLLKTATTATKTAAIKVIVSISIFFLIKLILIIGRLPVFFVSSGHCPSFNLLTRSVQRSSLYLCFLSKGVSCIPSILTISYLGNLNVSFYLCLSFTNLCYRS